MTDDLDENKYQRLPPPTVTIELTADHRMGSIYVVTANRHHDSNVAQLGRPRDSIIRTDRWNVIGCRLERDAHEIAEMARQQYLDFLDVVGHIPDGDAGQTVRETLRADQWLAADILDRPHLFRSEPSYRVITLAMYEPHPPRRSTPPEPDKPSANAAALEAYRQLLGGNERHGDGPKRKAGT